MFIQTRRLMIRPFSRDDWQDLKRIALDFQVSEYRYFDHEMPTEDEKVRAAAEHFASTGLWFSVIEPGSGMIGYICFHFEGGALDVGYSFRSSAHGNGYAYESVSALMELFVDGGMVTRFTAGTALDNAPSVRLLKRLGFVQTGAEETCFHEGHPFIGGMFEKRVDESKNRPQL